MERWGGWGMVGWISFGGVELITWRFSPIILVELNFWWPSAGLW